MATKVFYKQDNKGNYFYIIIKGHADFADKGKDIVCAAISAITNGAVNFLQTNYGDCCKISCNSAEISIYLQNNNPECQLVLKLMLYQLKNIEDYYPNYLKIN
ncbi:MAG: hypothetical protein GBAus27B_000392 [Mycoplasmataceae bacterium]|nr:MAG: hypothetical protein GBAus27B_000392 [Mycoplasmataceae bacterium]